jgi:hypothetical protein
VRRPVLIQGTNWNARVMDDELKMGFFFKGTLSLMLCETVKPPGSKQMSDSGLPSCKVVHHTVQSLARLACPYDQTALRDGLGCG